MQTFLHVSSIVILLGSLAAARAQSSPWYFNAEQMDAAYQYQRNYGQRLRNLLNPHDCYYGKAEFMAQFRGKTFCSSL